ncbi:MAG: DUF371 domain-containing protein [Sulfolobales archaeon]|nr:DUF371 domain-containing protein [Ignisphaera sp.]MCX8199715.1 DUF371 domain-containing protein [Sulfolobales archaeon]MDW8085866.1 DUF371 domain-containing protein [Ignisphaera sp.]
MIHRLISIAIFAEKLEARGHRAIRALHPTTFELTKDSDVSERGDCIIGVKLDRGLKEFDDRFKEALKRSSSIVVILLQVDDLKEVVLARGNNELILEDDRRIVVRKSRFIGPETLAVESNKASRDLDRDIVKRLQDPESILQATVYVLDANRILSQITSGVSAHPPSSGIHTT